MNNNLYKIEQSLRSIAKRYKTVKYLYYKKINQTKLII